MRSLQARMLLSSAVAGMLATALAAWAIAAVLERFVVAGLDGRLDAELALLAATVDGEGGVDRARLDGTLGGLAVGPGWRWRIEAPGGTFGTAALRPRSPPAPPLPPPADPDGKPPLTAYPAAVAGGGPRPVDGMDGAVPVHGRVLMLPTRRGPALLLAEAPRSVVRRPIREALVPLLSALSALVGLLALAAMVQLRFGLSPVRRLRDQLEAIRAGDRERVDETQPSELRPLAVALNALASDNRAALAAARRTGANLAHALKTPVAVLSLDLRDDPERAAQLARIDDIIRHHLRRARIDAVGRAASTALWPALDGVLTAIRQLHADRDLSILADGERSLSVAMDGQDLDELLGNLLDNAARHARREVRVWVGLDASDRRVVSIRIEDDGPGIPPDRREQVLRRGLRLDEREGGHGFGLAIVAESLSLHGGGIALGERAGGGLSVTVRVPGRAGG